jgi:hypothetical protein
MAWFLCTRIVLLLVSVYIPVVVTATTRRIEAEPGCGLYLAESSVGENGHRGWGIFAGEIATDADWQSSNSSNSSRISNSSWNTPELIIPWSDCYWPSVQQWSKEVPPCTLSHLFQPNQARTNNSLFQNGYSMDHHAVVLPGWNLLLSSNTPTQTDTADMAWTSTLANEHCSLGEATGRTTSLRKRRNDPNDGAHGFVMHRRRMLAPLSLATTKSPLQQGQQLSWQTIASHTTCNPPTLAAYTAPRQAMDTTRTEDTQASENTTTTHMDALKSPQPEQDSEAVLTSNGDMMAPLSTSQIENNGTVFAHRSVAWLSEHGMCLDRVMVQRQQQPQCVDRSGCEFSNAAQTAAAAAAGGRDEVAVVVARRFVAAGSMVVPAPVMALSRSHLEILSTDTIATGDEPEAGPKTVLGQQLVLNYCFGHANSSLLLFPYGPFVQFIRPADRTHRPNVALRWSNNSVAHEWFSFNVSTILHHQQVAFLSGGTAATLVMEYYALTDIDAGDEIRLDFGDAWQRAWQAHATTAWPRYWHVHNATRPQYEGTAESYWSAADYTHHCMSQPDDAQSHCLAETPSWISVHCWMAPLANLSVAHDDVHWLAWSPLQEKADFHNSQSCHVLPLHDNDNGTFRIRISPLSVEEAAVYVKGVPLSAIALVDRPYTTSTDLRMAFRHEMQLPDDMLPPAWRDVPVHDDSMDESCGYFMAPSAIPHSGWGMYTARDIGRGEKIFSGDVVIQVEDYEVNAKLRHWANQVYDSIDDFWLLHNYFWSSMVSLGNFDSAEALSVVPGLGTSGTRFDCCSTCSETKRLTLSLGS